jgi:hypothetical protein
LATKTAAATTSESSVGSSSEVNSSVSIKPAASKEDLADPLVKISHNLDFEEAADLYYQSDALEENFDDSSNFDSKEDFVDLYDGVSYGSNDEWMLGLELDDKEPTIFSSEPNNSNNTCPQVYAIIEETSEDLDSTSNTLSTHQTSEGDPGT